MLGFAASLEYKNMELSWRDAGNKALVLYLERETEAGRAVGEAVLGMRWELEDTPAVAADAR